MRECSDRAGRAHALLRWCRESEGVRRAPHLRARLEPDQRHRTRGAPTTNALLGAAIEKSTLGYRVEADAPVTEFWRAYWRMARDLVPELDMAEPIAKPARAGFISLRSPTLPRKVEICHKLPHGYVDLQFGGWGGRMPELQELVEPYLAPGMTAAKAEKSASIRLRVAPLNAARDFADQEAAAKDGIRAAGVLLAWWGAHLVALVRLVG